MEERDSFGNPDRFKVYPLHGSLATSDQRSVFDRPPEGIRKIVIATNIAETSITIDDVVYVIDSGRVRSKPASVMTHGDGVRAALHIP